MTNNRKGIILAGGTGTRLYPLTQAANKQLLPVYDKPMVYYPISCIMLAGITEILIISSPDMLPAYKKVLGTGEQFGVSFEYVEQKEPRGLSEAYILAEEFLKGCPSLMILGDNLFYGSGMTEHLKSSSKSEACTIFAYYVDNPSAYGVVSFDKEFNVTNIEEKPKNPQSHYAITGMYFFNEQASEYAKSIKPSARGELEITELQNIYLEEKKASGKAPRKRDCLA